MADLAPRRRPGQLKEEPPPKEAPMQHIGYIGLVLIFLRLRLRIRKKISPKRGTLSFELTISLIPKISSK
jgi:hypothetical protein